MPLGLFVSVIDSTEEGRQDGFRWPENVEKKNKS